MNDQFQVNGLVTVGVAGDTIELPSRIEDLDEKSLLVAIPPQGPRVLDESGTDEVFLHWVSIRGRYQQPALVVERVDLPLLQWRLQPYGEPELVQRRQYVRVATALGVQVEYRDEVSAGTTVDISEGSFRCLTEAKGLQPGSEVILRVTIEDKELVLPGQVLRTVHALHARNEVVVVFHYPGQYGDVIRRYVFKMQVRMRGVGQA